MRDAVIVAYGRSAIGKAPKGTLKDTRPEEYAAEVIKGVLAKVPQLDPAQIDDVILGCAMPEAEQGINVARNISIRAGIPYSVPAQTINRFCSSGLQSIATGANAIMADQADIILAGGVESMSKVPMGGNILTPTPYLMENQPDAETSMGITAENVAVEYNVSREDQDEFSLKSHQKALAAQNAGKFDSQIIPVHAVKIVYDENGKASTQMVEFAKDEGVRPNISMEGLTKLRPVFKVNGTVTAGNASQTNDAAAAVIIMAKERAEELGIKPIAKFVSYAVAGVDPALMGIGPTEAIPKALAIAGLKLEDIDLIELNEAFASQAIACIRTLGLNEEIVNVNGGAIALGHPLGCTGSILTAKLLAEMEDRGSKYGIVSMCIGGGMGAAAVYEMI